MAKGDYYDPLRCCVCGETLAAGEWHVTTYAFVNGRELYGSSHKVCVSPLAGKLLPMRPGVEPPGGER